jgi:hypothetical protein
MIPPFARRTAPTVAAALVTVCIGAAVVGARGVALQEPAPGDDAALRSRVEARYEVVPLSRGVGLRPRDRTTRIQLIEVSDGTIAIDGVPVSGSVLRERVGTDADLIFQLSYLTPQRLRAVFGAAEAAPPADVPREAPPPEPPAKPEPPARPELPRDREVETRRRGVGDRVRVFGSVNVERDEEVRGEVVAVLGSARVDGHVSDSVIAVLGSVDLGPEARVGGDVIAVGGRVRQADGAEIRGSVTEVPLSPNFQDARGFGWWAMPGVYPFTGAARLAGTMFRLFVLGLLASMIVLVARQPVERIGHRVVEEPVKMAAIGLLAQLLVFPLLVLTSVVLAISIIGIPFLLLIPVALVALLLILLGGFSGVAQALGGWMAARAGWNAEQPLVRAWLGVLLLFAPLLTARLLGFIGGPWSVLPAMLAGIALLIEYIVWTTGFGAALTTAYESRRRRPLSPPPPPPPPPEPERAVVLPPPLPE